MAKLSSTAAPSSRAGSAQPDAPAATAPARTTRSTRSQSREPVELADSTSAAPKKRFRKGKVNADLEPVAETIDNEEEVQAAALATEQDAASSIEDEVPVDEVDAARRESAHSGISGTTAKTSFSQEEIANLDADVIVDLLPNLADAAEQMTKLLVPADPQVRPVIWKEIRVHGSRYSKLYENRLALLGVNKHTFGSQDYIQPSVVLRALLGVTSTDEVSDGPWRPDSILYKANLAQMLRAILVLVVNHTELTQEGYNALEHLDTSFGAAIAGPRFDLSAFRLQLHLQTQLTLIRLGVFKESPQFDALEIITDSFFTRDTDGELIYKDAHTLHLTDADETEMRALMNVIQQRVNDLKAPFEEGQPTDDALGQLRGLYPWTRLVAQVVGYYEHRSPQLDQHIKEAGGFYQVMNSLSQEVQRREDARQAEVHRQSFGKPGSTPKKGFGKGAIAALKAREKRLSEVAPEPPAATTPAPQAAPIAPMMDPALTAPQPGEATAGPDDGWVPPPGDDEVDQPTAQQRAVSALQLTGFQNQQRQNAKKGKRRYVDRQDDAYRVSFDESQPSQQAPSNGSAYQLPTRSSAPGPYHVGSSRTPTKRTHGQASGEPEEFEPTQDGGFETDTRDPAAADARRRLAPAPRYPMPQRPREHPAGSANTVAYEVPGLAPQSPSKRQRKNPGSAIPAPMRPLDPDEENVPREEYYERAKVLAKHGRIVATQTRPSQIRTPFSREEENALIALIENYGGEGISYATLKKQDENELNVLERRSAEDMRFKARNMKQTMLAAHVGLPENWEHVVLDRKAITKLRERGIAYQQDAIRSGRGTINEEAPGA